MDSASNNIFQAGIIDKTALSQTVDTYRALHILEMKSVIGNVKD